VLVICAAASCAAIAATVTTAEQIRVRFAGIIALSVTAPTYAAPVTDALIAVITVIQNALNAVKNR